MALLDTVTLSQASLAVVSLYIAWSLLRPFVVKTALDNIQGPLSASLLTGNINQFASRHSWDFREELARRYGRTTTICGLFNKKWLITHDPKALHYIFIKDQEIYREPILTLRILVGPGLLGTEGEQHRRQRKMLDPALSTKHLREMTPLFYDIIHKTRDAMAARVRALDMERTAGPGAELDMLSWMGRTTLEVLGQAALGYSFDPLIEDVPDEFATAVRSFFPQAAKSVVPRILLPFAVKLGSPAFRRRMVDLISSESVQGLQRISDKLHARSVQIFNEKKVVLVRGDDAVKRQIGEGRDIMSILLRANMMASADDRLSDEELVAQISTMILAGMDTTSNTLAQILELLAANPDRQERLRGELIAAVEAEGEGDTLDFDRLMELPYLDAVCRETLRLRPGAAFIFRDASKDTVLPLTTPVRGLDGTLYTAIPVPKGTRVVADVHASNRDPTTRGADADQWRPERWLEGLPKTIEDAGIPGVYSHMMTFIGGGKACIGFKFAQLEIKTVLLIMLQSFRFELTEKPIVWNFASVQYPTVGEESTEPGMPLKVALL